MVPLHMATQWRTPEFGNLPFELLDVGAVVRQPVTVQHVVDAREETVAIADIGTPYVQLFGERRRFSKDGEVKQVGLGARLGRLGFLPRALYYTALMAIKKSDARALKLLVIGSSGHASVLVDAVTLTGGYEIVGYADDTLPSGTVRRGYPVLGGFKDAAKICADQRIGNVVVAVGDNWWRRKVYSDLIEKCPELRFPIVRHPSAIVAASAEIGQGAAVLAGSHVGPGSRVGEFCILNTGSSVDHDCTLHNFSSIAPGVFMGGLVTIGECSAIGVGASISDRISIGRHTVVGTGAVVVRDIPDLVVAYGNPARTKRSRAEGEKYVEDRIRRRDLS